MFIEFGTNNKIFLFGKNNLRKIHFYFIFNIRHKTGSSPRLKFIFLDEKNNILYSTTKKAEYIKNKSFYSLDVENLLGNTRNKKIYFTLSLEKTHRDSDYVALWQFENGELVLIPEYKLEKLSAMKRNFYLFLPTFLTGIIILVMLLEELFKNKIINLNRKQIFIAIILPFLFVNAIFFVFWVNHMALIDEQSHFNVIKTIAKKEHCQQYIRAEK